MKKRLAHLVLLDDIATKIGESRENATGYIKLVNDLKLLGEFELAEPHREECYRRLMEMHSALTNHPDTAMIVGDFARKIRDNR